ncbi:MAG: Gfo/Idh/MocA family protein [Planctomycetota bacterium]|jgi:predicted dehydrogenase
MKKINRRKFLKKTAAAVTGTIAFPYIVPSPALGANGSVAPSNRIVMGCIGVGGKGTGDMRGFILKPQVQIVAVCDVQAELRDRARNMVNEYYNNKGCTAYNDFREIIGRGDIDAVTIGTPDHWHAIPAIMAAKAGKDIHCQKPLAHNIGEGRAICDAVKKYGVVWQTGSQQRSQRSFRQACELVRNGRIGKVHTVEVGLPTRWQQTCPPQPVQPIPEGFDYNMWLGPAPWAPYTEKRCIPLGWRWIYDYASGLITDWGAHHLDISQWGMGTEQTGPVEIQAEQVVFGQGGLWDTANRYRVTCRYAEGFTLIVADTDKLRQGIRFIGPDGWVHVSRKYGVDTHPKSLLDSRIGPNEIHLYESDDHIGNFLDCVRTRRETVAPVEVAHRSVAIGHLGTIAMKTGRKLKWDPQKERFIGDDEANRLLSRPMRSPWRI